MSNSEDLSALQAKLESLEKKVHFYKTILDQTYDWEIFRDENGKIVYVNDAFERITGFKKDDLLSGLITEKDLVHPDDWQIVLDAIGRTKAMKEVIDLQFRIIRKDNTIRHINLCSKPVFEDEKFVGARTSARDITTMNDFIELQKKNEEIETVKNRFFNYINSSPTSIFLVD